MFKKILVLLLTLSVLTTCASAVDIVNSSEQNPNKFILGDVNNDMLLDIIDVAIMRSHCIGIEDLFGISFYFADTNNDSDVNIIDI